MPEDPVAEELYSALQESARLLGAVCSREKVWPILHAYSKGYANGGVVFSAEAGRHAVGELDYGLSLPSGIGDAYAHALSHGFVAASDHPIGSLLTDVQALCATYENFADCGVVGGFRKLYAHFPRSLQSVSKLAEVPSMPRSVARNVDLFARHGMDDVAMVGANYKDRAVSLYFQFTPESRPDPDTIRSLLREIGMVEANQRMLEFAHKSMRANITLSYDSPDIQRVAFAPPPGPCAEKLAQVPVAVSPGMERFVTSAPRAYEGERICLFAVKWTRDEEFLEGCTYFRIPPKYEPMRLRDSHDNEA